MNKKELIAQMCSQSGMTRNDAEGALNAFFDVVLDTLKHGDEIRLVGFGSFKISKRKATTGRNPRTGDPIKIAASNRPTFKAGKEFIDSINK